MHDESSRNTGPIPPDLTTSEPSEVTISPPATSSPEGSPAPISPQPAMEPALLEESLVCGKSLPGSFASFDPATSSWKTPAPSPGVASQAFSATWPRSGMMQNGTAFQLPPLAPRISVTVATLLPTPRATDGERGGRGDLLAVLKGRAQHGYKAHPEFSMDPLTAPRGGHTNPEFVEWCMGFPLGWTSLD
jgi:hypothetical protein